MLEITRYLLSELHVAVTMFTAPHSTTACYSPALCCHESMVIGHILSRTIPEKVKQIIALQEKRTRCPPTKCYLWHR